MMPIAIWALEKTFTETSVAVYKGLNGSIDKSGVDEPGVGCGM